MSSTHFGTKLVFSLCLLKVYTHPIPFIFHLLPNTSFKQPLKLWFIYKYQILVSPIKFIILCVHLKLELLDTLSSAVQSGPHRSPDKLLCTSRSLEHLLREEAQDTCVASFPILGAFRWTELPVLSC